jgi:CO dehydrogenase/acetyl-CoA synthase beta subunit
VSGLGSKFSYEFCYGKNKKKLEDILNEDIEDKRKCVICGQEFVPTNLQLHREANGGIKRKFCSKCSA